MTTTWAPTWRGMAIGSVSDLLTAACSCQTSEDAASLLSTYAKAQREAGYAESVARQNLGYALGYLGNEDRTRLYSLFNLRHPIFGNQP